MSIYEIVSTRSLFGTFLALYPDLRMATHNVPSEQSARTGMAVHTRITHNPEKRENTTAVERCFRPQPYINALG